MLLHEGERFQAGRGIGSLFAGLFRSLRPLASMGLKAVKNLVTSDVAKQIGSTALDIGTSTLKNIAADIIEGKDPKQSLNQGLEEAQTSISSKIRGSGRKKRKKHCRPAIETKKCKFNLLQ